MGVSRKNVFVDLVIVLLVVGGQERRESGSREVVKDDFVSN